MIRLRTAFVLAKAETRRARGTLAFCVLSVAIGVMAITAIRSVTGSLRQSIDGQARNLLGGDLLLRGQRPLSQGPAAELSRKLTEQGARSANSVTFYSMLTRARSQADGKGTQLVRVRAVGDGFPFYGHIETLPSGKFEALGSAPAVLLDPAVARALSLKAGDQVRLGQLEARVLGEFVKQPGSPAAAFSMAPYVYLHERHLQATGLLATGSRVRYERLFALPASVSAERFQDEHQEMARQAHLSIRTSRESASNVRRFLSRLSGFLTVVGLVTLFLGALGIGSAMRAFMDSRLDHAAVLRAVGARPRDLLLIYGMLSLLVALSGSLLGAAAGALVPLLLQGASESLAAGMLPADVELSVSPLAMLHGVAAGTLATFAFTLVPIWRTSAVAPLRVLGRGGEPWKPLGSARWAGVVGAAAALTAVFVLSLSETGSLRIGSFFTLGIGVSWFMLTGLARGIVAVAGRVGPRLGSFHLRQGIANLHRPGNQTRSVIVAVGMGFLLLGTLMILQQSLRQLLALEQHAELPNLFIIDIQPDQRAGVQTLLQQHGASGLELSPMISARIGQINRQATDHRDAVPDASQQPSLNRRRTREYFLSYRAEPAAAETVTAGRFWSGRPKQQEASLDQDLAKSLGIELGDTLTLDIQGIPLNAKVTSFRDIRWQALRPNAMILLSPGEIEAAPKMFVASARLLERRHRQDVQHALVERYSNLTVVDAAEAAQTVLMILSRISSVFAVLGLLAVITGAIIVGGAIAAGRFARQREAMLFKVLGASRRDLHRILLAEYACLALLGIISGWLLCEALNRAAIPSLFEAEVSVPYTLLGALAAFALVLNTGVGVFVGRRVARRTPLSVLREE